MFKHTDSGRSRGTLWAVLVTVAAMAAALTTSLGIAHADTTGTPDPTVTASFAPAAPSAAPGATLAGARTATPFSVVNVHIVGDGTFNGLNIARLCTGTGFTPTLGSQLDPGDFGKCIAHPFTASSDDDAIGPITADSTTHVVDFSFRVGSGTETFTENDGTTQSTITCDASHPCALWIDESVNTSANNNGEILKHYQITYAGTPGAPTGVVAAPGNQQCTIGFTAPSNTGNSSAPLSYTVTVTGPGGGQQTGTATSGYVFTGLTNGTTYPVSVTATSTAADGSHPPASAAGTTNCVPAAPPGPTVQQTISATRPQGALVLTQVCGDHGATPGHPTPVTHSGSTPGVSGPPEFPAGSGVADPQYPNYPTQGSYPTNCNVSLGTAHLITSGNGKGQFYEATGVLSQVTVVDGRDADVGFTVNGQMSRFQGAVAGNSFSGSELGWTPASANTPPFTDSDGHGYAQYVKAGPVVPANSPSSTGLSNSGSPSCSPLNADGSPAAGGSVCGSIGLNVLGSAAGRHAHATGDPACLPSATTDCFVGGLGIATLDADLDLYIPIFAHADTYTGVLTISAI